MLILSRRNGESLIIGEDIKITILSQRSNQVRIGIDAPRSMPVHREEVLLREQADKEPTPPSAVHITYKNGHKNTRKNANETEKES